MQEKLTTIISSLGDLAPFAISTIILFLLVREIVCWYFKINEKIKLSKSILAELEKINRQC